jgi:hypothetical protein
MAVSATGSPSKRSTASRFAPPNTEPVAADFELERIPQRRATDESNFHAGSQPHLQQTQRNLIIAGHSNDARLGAHR